MPLFKRSKNYTILNYLEKNIVDNLIIFTQSFDVTIVSENITRMCDDESHIVNLIEKKM